jgi:hypothetical protein
MVHALRSLKLGQVCEFVLKLYTYSSAQRINAGGGHRASALVKFARRRSCTASLLVAA